MRPKRKASTLFFAVGIFTVLLSAPVANQALAQSCVSPPAGMIAWWPMDENAGTTVLDAAGSNSGVHVGAPTHEAGEVGRALHFDGSRSFVAVKDNDLWAFGSSDFTIELWANFATPGGGSIGQPTQVFISNDESPGTANKWFFSLGGGFLTFHINGPGIGDQFVPRVPFSPQVGRWYHLAVRRSGSLYTIFIDGEPSGSGRNLFAVPNANALLTIGEAEGLFHMKGLLDEVTIFNRGLDDAELRSIFQAGSAGKCKPPKITTRVLTSAQLGESYDQTLRAEFGTPPYTWSVAGGSLPSGIALGTSGILSGTPQGTGSFSFAVSLVDAAGKTAAAPLSLEVSLIPPPPAIRINKVGNLPVPGRTIDYFLVVENAGSATAKDIEVAELLDPLEQFRDPSFASPPPSKIVGNILVWNIGLLNPGEFKLLSYSVTIAPSVAIGDLVKGQAVQVCAQCKEAPPCFYLYQICSVSAPELPTGIGLPDLIGIIISDNSISKECSQTALACIEECKNRCPHASHDENAQGPTDPNEKLVVAKRFVRPEQTLVYPIHFENIGTIEARDVFVTDVLDSALDEGTLNIITPQGASYKASTRTLRWDLLNANLPPGETGNVLFAVKPRQNTPSGTAIRNMATIKFEVFASLDTNRVETVIDTTPPSCVVDSLPARSTTLTVPLSWTGTDAVGQIGTYSVLVSTNGGPYALLVGSTHTTNMTFLGVAGNSYGFTCIAADTAGNVEVQQAVAETTTLVQPDTTPPTITVSASPATLWPPNGRMVSVTISGSMIDTEAGVNAGKAVYAVTDEYGRVQPSGAVTLGSDGSYSFTISLQASRDGQDTDGRHYRINVGGQDNAGNAGSASAAATVPHDRR